MEWGTVLAALAGALVTAAVQVFLATAEPRAVRRIQRLSEAIDTIPKGDPARRSLKAVRRVWARRLEGAVVCDNPVAIVFRTVSLVLLVIMTILLVSAVALPLIFDVPQVLVRQLVNAAVVATVLGYIAVGAAIASRPGGWRRFARAVRLRRRRNRDGLQEQAAPSSPPLADTNRV